MYSAVFGLFRSKQQKPVAKAEGLELKTQPCRFSDSESDGEPDTAQPQNVSPVQAAMAAKTVNTIDNRLKAAERVLGF